MVAALAVGIAAKKNWDKFSPVVRRHWAIRDAQRTLLNSQPDAVTMTVARSASGITMPALTGAGRASQASRDLGSLLGADTFPNEGVMWAGTLQSSADGSARLVVITGDNLTMMVPRTEVGHFDAGVLRWTVMRPATLLRPTDIATFDYTPIGRLLFSLKPIRRVAMMPLGKVGPVQPDPNDPHALLINLAVTDEGESDAVRGVARLVLRENDTMFIEPAPTAR